MYLIACHHLADPFHDRHHHVERRRVERDFLAVFQCSDHHPKAVGLGEHPAPEFFGRVLGQLGRPADQRF
jgi:hypothetical protein